MKRKSKGSPFLLTAMVSLLLLICLLAMLTQISAASASCVPTVPEREEILAEFEVLVEKTRKEFGIPGMAVAVVQGDEVIYSKGFGVREAGKKEPVNPGTVFQIGSTSKAFTVALVAGLVEEGALGWKDPVVKHLPNFAMADPWVTDAFQVRDLMAQHSGMKPYAGDILSLLGYGREEIVRSTALIRPVSSFRSEFSYVNNLWVTAAALIEEKTEKSWERNLQERILDPLGMENTTYSKEGLISSLEATTLHIVKNGKVVPLKADWPFFEWPYIYGPAGGINSTVEDMAKWVRFQLGDGTFGGRKILSPENLAYPHQPQTPINDKNSYCMGWVKSDFRPFPLIWHNGETTGCKTLVLLVPQLKLGMVILSNLGTTAPEALGRTFVDMYCGNVPAEDYIAKAMKAGETTVAEANGKKRPEKAYPPMDYSVYEGLYESVLFGKGKVLQKKGGLLLEVGPLGRRLVLKPWDRDIFTYEIEDLGLDDVEELSGMVQFGLSPDGQVIAFDMTDDDGDPVSRFIRSIGD